MWIQVRLFQKLKLLLLVALSGILLFIGWFYYLVNATIKLPFLPYEFSIESGSDLKSISRQLAADNPLPNAWSFILLSKVLGHESSIKAGDYVLVENISPLQLLR